MANARKTKQQSVINVEVIDTFWRDGVVRLPGVFDQEWVDLVTRGVERNMAEPGPYAETLWEKEDSGRFLGDYCNWRRIPEYRDFVLNSPAAEIAAKLMRSTTAIFYHDHLLTKEPGTLKQTPWHHDQPYYPVAGRQGCSIWMPIDPVSKRNCLSFVKGSHNWGRLFVPRKFATATNYSFKDLAIGLAEDLYSVPDIDDHPEKYEILGWDLKPGDCIVFHMATLHGAGGNVSLSTPRRVLSTRWLGDDARFAERPWEISPPITGGLKPGDPMACDEFPVVWCEASIAREASSSD